MPINIGSVMAAAEPYDETKPTKNVETFFGFLIGVLTVMYNNGNLLITPEEKLNTYSVLLGNLLETFRAGDFSITIEPAGIILSLPNGTTMIDGGKLLIEAVEQLLYNHIIFDLGAIRIIVDGRTVTVEEG